MARDDFKSHDIIAITAGIRTGLLRLLPAEIANMPEAERSALTIRVADHPESAKLRDQLTADYSRRLRDPAYSGDAVWAWFKTEYGRIGRTSIYRARASLEADESQIEQSAALANAFVELADKSGADNVFKAASKRAGQIIFQLLMELNADKLGGKLSLSKIMGVIGALSKLQQSRAQADLIGEKVDQLRKAAKDALGDASRKTPDGKLSRVEIFRVLDDAMRGKAA